MRKCVCETICDRCGGDAGDDCSWWSIGWRHTFRLEHSDTHFCHDCAKAIYEATRAFIAESLVNGHASTNGRHLDAE